MKQLQQWFALNDMSEEGSITAEAAQRIAEQEDGTASLEELNEVLLQVRLYTTSRRHVEYTLLM